MEESTSWGGFRLNRNRRGSAVPELIVYGAIIFRNLFMHSVMLSHTSITECMT